MSGNRKLKPQEMYMNLLNSIKMMEKRRETTTEEYFAALRKYGFEFSEEKIIEDYSRVKDAETLDNMYYEQYGKTLDNNQKEKWLNSDAFLLLIDRIIPEHFDIQETGDPYFISTALDDLYRNDLKKTDQKDIEKILRALTVYSNTRNQHTLNHSLELFNMNGVLSDLIRICHKRTPSFRTLVRELYECFEDMDPRIFPSVYREWQKTKISD